MTNRPDMNDWENQVNALLDGELNDAEADSLKLQARQDHALASAIIEAYQLQQLMAALPIDRAPDSLRRKLAAIPGEASRLTESQARDNGRWLRGLQPRWAMALAAVPLVIALAVQYSAPQRPTDIEVAQAREDLALALSYLQKASQVTGREIENSIGTGMRDPVRDTTVRTIADQLEFDKEQEA